MTQEIDYLNPSLPSGLRRVSMPVVDATPTTLDGFGRLVADPSECSIEIVQWPAMGARPVDAGTGDEAGTTEGTFVSEWRGDILYGRNEAVGGNYILAYAVEPEAARDDNTNVPERMPIPLRFAPSYRALVTVFPVRVLVMRLLNRRKLLNDATGFSRPLLTRSADSICGRTRAGFISKRPMTVCTLSRRLTVCPTGKENGEWWPIRADRERAKATRSSQPASISDSPLTAREPTLRRTPIAAA